MARRVYVCKVSDLDTDRPTKFIVEGVGLAVYSVESQYFATSDTCTHATASLSEDGVLEGYTIECTWHGGKFDIRTGAVLAMPCTDALKTYPVTLERDSIYVELSDGPP